MSYFGGPALVHQVNILVSSDPKQAQTCGCSKNKQASITAHLCSASQTRVTLGLQTFPQQWSDKGVHALTMSHPHWSEVRLNKQHTPSQRPPSHKHTTLPTGLFIETESRLHAVIKSKKQQSISMKRPFLASLQEMCEKFKPNCHCGSVSRL